MALNKVSELPTAKDINDRSLTTAQLRAQLREEQRQLAERNHLDQIDAYLERMVSVISQVLSDPRGQRCAFFHLPISWKDPIRTEWDRENRRSCPLQYIHYGHMVNGWNNRRPFVPGRNPFRELQLQLYNEKGFYLLDESDSSRGHDPHITLYSYRPPHYGSVRLWHGFNIIEGVE